MAVNQGSGLWALGQLSVPPSITQRFPFRSLLPTPGGPVSSVHGGQESVDILLQGSQLGQDRPEALSLPEPLVMQAPALWAFRPGWD